MEHDAVWDLIGVYALDACDQDENEAVEAHMADCADCEAEAARLREIAGWIGVSEATTPSVELRSKLLDQAERRVGPE
jgi:anti-sigma factor RsiW